MSLPIAIGLALALTSGAVMLTMAFGGARPTPEPATSVTASIFVAAFLLGGLAMVFLPVREMTRESSLRRATTWTCGEVVKCQLDTNDDGARVLHVEYRFQPPGFPHLVGSTQRPIADSETVQPPSEGQKIAVLYASQRLHRML